MNLNVYSKNMANLSKVKINYIKKCLSSTCLDYKC